MENPARGNGNVQREIHKVHTLRNILVWIFIGYFVIGHISLLRKHHETFPIYSWYLFAKTPVNKANYEVYVISYQDQNFDPPVEFRQSPLERIVRGRKSIIAKRVIENFGKAFDAKDSEGIAHQKELFESNHLKPGTKYRLVRKVYDPIEYYKTKTAETTVLADYEYGIPASSKAIVQPEVTQ